MPETAQRAPVLIDAGQEKHVVLQAQLMPREEISQQLSYVGSWGGKLVFPIPEFEIVSMG